MTHPESGTTSFNYHGDGSLNRKIDAKGQRIEFVYDSDGRITEAKRFINSTTEDGCQKVTYSYGSNPYDGSFSQNVAARLEAVARGCSGTGGGQFIEMFSYNPAGALLKKRLRIVKPTGSVNKDVSYGYMSDGKLETVLYPDATVPYTYIYNLLDQPTKMTGPSILNAANTIDHVKNVNYGVAGQVTSMQIVQYEDTSPNYFTESKTYDTLFQLTGIISMGMNVSYNFPATTNNGRIEARMNNLTSQTVTYGYDALNRLTSATATGGTVSGLTHGLQFRPDTWFTVLRVRAAGEEVS